MRRAISWRSTTSSSTTRVPICVPTRSRSRTSPPRCCPAPIGFPRIAPSAGSGSPTRRRAALIGRRVGSRARSRASVSWTRSRPRSASMRSRCAAATSLRRPRCRTGACSARSAPRWCSIPAITPDCSTRRSRRSAGRRSRPRCASDAPRASGSAGGSGFWVDIRDGGIFGGGGKAGPSIELGEVARVLAASRSHSDASPALAAEGTFRTDHMTYPYGVHIAVVRVDGDTGGVKVERYFVAYDVGKAVNPLLIEGQLARGAVQGLGGALFEEFVYDARGEPLAVTFADYLIPTAREG